MDSLVRFMAGTHRFSVLRTNRALQSFFDRVMPAAAEQAGRSGSRGRASGALESEAARIDDRL